MPPRGGEVRAEQLGDARSRHPREFISPEIGRLLEELRGFEESQHDTTPFEASLIRVGAARLGEGAPRARQSCAAEIARSSSLALPRLGGGRAKNPTSAIFLPALRNATSSCAAATSSASTREATTSRTTCCSTTTSRA